MKVLCNTSNPRHRYVILGLSYVFKELGYEFIEWNPEEIPAFDVFDNLEPDIYLGPCPDRAIIKCLNERKDFIKQKLIDDIEYAGDTFTFHEGEFVYEYASEVVYVGNFKEEIANLGHSEFQLKVCSYQPWPIPQYVGTISTSSLPNFYKSAKVSITFDNKEKVYQVLMSGGFPLSTVLHDFSFNLPFVEINKLRDGINVFRSNLNAKNRQGIIDEARQSILDTDTYWHRIAELFTEWKMGREAQRTLKEYNEFGEI